jgi:sulfate permease, SulP family
MWSAISQKLNDRWLPKSVICLREYSLNKFLRDVIAGITVGLVALPLAMAFAIASGLTPQAGIYCAVVTGFLISALGGSKTQIGGPTGAFVVVVAGIVAVHGTDGLYMCTVMAGAILIVLGATGMGTAVKFIPRPVVIGFTNGIAVLIASTPGPGGGYHAEWYPYRDRHLQCCREPAPHVQLGIDRLAKMARDG